jgi:hypothetical protein
MKTLSFVLSVSLVALASSCSGGDAKQASKGSTPAQENALAPFVAASKPDGAKPVLAVRASAKAGDQVVVAGRVMDFVDGRAAFTLIDPSLPSCDEEGPMKTCETPWDFCCTDVKVISNASATVELRNSAGVIKQGLQGFRGIDHLVPTVVVGKLETDPAGNLLVAANQIWIGNR